MSKCSLLVWFPFLSIAAWPAPPIGPAGQPEIEVRLYNYAEAPDQILDLAYGEVKRAYAEIGVLLQWVDCPTQQEDIDLYPRCTSKLPPHALVVRLLPRSMKAPVKDDLDTLGFAMVGANIKRPILAGVLYDNIENLGFTERVNAPAVVRGLPFHRFMGLVVGRVIAHEISHLLGVRTHGMGLMRANLTPWAIQEALAQRRGGFSRKEARRMLREIARRSGEEPADTGGG